MYTYDNFDIICITNRKLCDTDLSCKVSELCKAGADRIILREKDLSEHEYVNLARRILSEAGERLILHSFPSACAQLNAPRLHLPLHVLKQNSNSKQKLTLLGASVHSTAEAKEAERLGVDYVITGHIFDTGCKPDIPGRGLSYLRNICECVSIPVYAIGGISPENIAKIRLSGAKGACVMSGAMQSNDVYSYIKELREAL